MLTNIQVAFEFEFVIFFLPSAWCISWLLANKRSTIQIPEIINFAFFLDFVLFVRPGKEMVFINAVSYIAPNNTCNGQI